MRQLRAFVVGFALFQAGCGHSLPSPTVVPHPASAPVVVPSEPPPGLVETLPPRPVDGAVWVDGAWTWARRRWTWLPGSWSVPPPGATYSLWMVVRAPDGAVYFAAGGWRDVQGEAIPAPKPLAVAEVAPFPLITRADGETTRIIVKTAE